MCQGRPNPGKCHPTFSGPRQRFSFFSVPLLSRHALLVVRSCHDQNLLFEIFASLPLPTHSVFQQARQSPLLHVCLLLRSFHEGQPADLTSCHTPRKLLVCLNTRCPGRSMNSTLGSDLAIRPNNTIAFMMDGVCNFGDESEITKRVET